MFEESNGDCDGKVSPRNEQDVLSDEDKFDLVPDKEDLQTNSQDIEDSESGED